MDSNSPRKEELYSQSINAGKRKYFFDVKETKGGDQYIVIAESRKLFDSNSGNFYFEKNKMFLYKEDFEKFQKGLENALSFIATGIVPPPVDDGHYRPTEDNGENGQHSENMIDGIDFNY